MLKRTLAIPTKVSSRGAFTIGNITDYFTKLHEYRLPTLYYTIALRYTVQRDDRALLAYHVLPSVPRRVWDHTTTSSALTIQVERRHVIYLFQRRLVLWTMKGLHAVYLDLDLIQDHRRRVVPRQRIQIIRGFLVLFHAIPVELLWGWHLVERSGARPLLCFVTTSAGVRLLLRASRC